MKGILYGIGVGPGDPELLTYKAARILQEVDCVAVPVAERDRESTARKIAGSYIRADCCIIELDFPMTRDQSLLEEAWQEGCAVIRKLLDKGQSVAFLTLGDAMLYSTYIYIFQHLSNEGYSARTIPGIPSFSAAASAGGFPLAFGDEKMAVMPGSAIEDLTNGRLEHFETVVIFKVARQFRKLVEALDKAGRLESSVLVVSCGHPEERVITDLKSVVDEDLSYFSLIISRKEPVL
jgi:precorrin-2/cobalt-factor-2 C20-methyltransferase